MVFPIYAQQEKSVPSADKTRESVEAPDAVEAPAEIEVPESPDNTRVTLGQNEVLIVEDKGDTVKVKLGSRGVNIVEGEDGTEIKILDMQDEGSDEKSSESKNRKKKFKPHFAGFEVGLNNYLNAKHKMSLPQGSEFMDLNTGRSWNFNLNILEYGIGFGSDKIGAVTGLGFEWINYVFDADNSITKNEQNVIISYTPQGEGSVVKSKLNMTYLTVPLLLELQIPAGKKRIHLSGGLIGGVKVASNTRIKYADPKAKEKIKDDLNLAPLRYGATVRIGYRAINLFANYYLSPLFTGASDPELYPLSVGLTVIPF